MEPEDWDHDEREEQDKSFKRKPFLTNEIRHTRSKEKQNLFVLIDKKPNKKKKKKPSREKALFVAVGVISVLAIVLSIIILSSGKDTYDKDPTISPSGSKLDTVESIDPSDSEQRIDEAQKMDTLLDLISNEDWNYAYSVFKTIFTAYLDDCGRYDYYRSAILLEERINDFEIPSDVLNERSEMYFKRCER